MKKSIIILSVIVSSYINCQNLTVTETNQKITYSELNTYLNSGFVRANIDPVNVLASKSRFTISSRLGIRFYKAGFYANASGDLHYMDDLASETDQMFGNSIYQPQKSRNINAVIGYFINWKKNGKVYFHLEGHRTAYVSVDKYAKVETDYRNFFGIEGGFSVGFSNLTYKGDGLKVKDYYNSNEQTIDHYFTTYMQYTWLHFGFSFGKIVDARCVFKDYGERFSSYLARYYVHITLPVNSNLEDVYYTPENGSSTTLTYHYILNDEVPVSKLGFRAGYEHIPMKRILGYGWEIGSMPGIQKGGNLYLSVKVSLNFGAKI